MLAADDACGASDDFDAPFPHGPFLVEPGGALHSVRAPAMRFLWRGRRCEVRITGERILFSLHAGAPPYTAERPRARAAALAAIGALPEELPPGWRLCVLPDHRLRLEAEAPLPAPTTAIALVARMVRFALALDPYLDRLDCAGVVTLPSSDSAGTAKT